jgi:hypothetical protein
MAAVRSTSVAGIPWPRQSLFDWSANQARANLRRMATTRNTPAAKPTVNGRDTPTEITILARFLANGDDKLPPAIARYLLSLRPSERDKARMHDLAVRNQDDALSPAEREELFAYARAGTVVSILKSKARKALGTKAAKRSAP